MSRTKKLTLGFMVFIALAIAGYDYWVWKEPTGGDTISEILQGWSMTSHTVALLMGSGIGFVLGHLFWGMRSPKK